MYRNALPPDRGQEGRVDYRLASKPCQRQDVTRISILQVVNQRLQTAPEEFSPGMRIIAGPRPTTSARNGYLGSASALEMTIVQTKTVTRPRIFALFSPCETPHTYKGPVTSTCDGRFQPAGCRLPRNAKKATAMVCPVQSACFRGGNRWSEPLRQVVAPDFRQLGFDLARALVRWTNHHRDEPAA